MRPPRTTAALLLLLAASPAAGQEDPRFPACTPAREGVTACLDGKLCLCRHQPGGSLTARPSGLRWDCGVLRPGCGPPPVEPGALPVPLPPVLLQPLLPGWPRERGPGR